MLSLDGYFSALQIHSLCSIILIIFVIMISFNKRSLEKLKQKFLIVLFSSFTLISILDAVYITLLFYQVNSPLVFLVFKTIISILNCVGIYTFLIFTLYRIKSISFKNYWLMVIYSLPIWFVLFTSIRDPDLNSIFIYGFSKNTNPTLFSKINYYVICGFLIMDILISFIYYFVHSDNKSLRLKCLRFCLYPMPLVSALIIKYETGLGCVCIGTTLSLIMIFAFSVFQEIQIHESKVEITTELANLVASIIDLRDSYTTGHSNRVATYSCMIGKKLGFTQEELNELNYIALLHDTGKIIISPDIINKPAKLSPSEYEKIKQHTKVGYEILSKAKGFPNLSVGALSHHERYDGKGYPDGLIGEDIPLTARIIAVADSYDAMTSYRSYRAPISQRDVRNEFVRNKGTQFDPKIADIMVEIIDEDKEFLLKESERDNKTFNDLTILNQYKQNQIINSLIRDFIIVVFVDFEKNEYVNYSTGEILDAWNNQLVSNDYFKDFTSYINHMIIESDRKRVSDVMQKRNIERTLKRHDVIYVDFQAKLAEETTKYYQLKIVKLCADEKTNIPKQVIIGIHDIDEMVKERRKEEAKLLNSINNLYNVCSTFETIYKVNVSNGKGEVLYFNPNGATELVNLFNEGCNWNVLIDYYVYNFVVEEDQSYFLKNASLDAIMEFLNKNKILTLEYDSVYKNKNYRMKLICVKNDDKTILISSLNMDKTKPLEK